MAAFRRISGRVRIAYYDSKSKTKKDIKRSKIKHLDSLSDDEVQAWVDKWSANQGPKVVRILSSHLAHDEELSQLFERFLTNYQILNRTSTSTLATERGRFYRHIIPVMVGKFKKKDVRSWNWTLPQLVSELIGSKRLAIEQVRKCIFLLQRFSKHLTATGVIEREWVVELPSAMARHTPLEVKLKPSEVLAFTNSGVEVRVKLMALLGYFGGLRPSEVFGLRKADFLTGAAAIAASPTYLRFIGKGGLGSKLCLSIARYVGSDGKIVEKTKGQNLRDKKKKKNQVDVAKEFVSVWDSEAAKQLAAIIKTLPDGRLFKVGRKRLFTLWSTTGYVALGVTLHDLRRACGFYLGREIEVTIQLLQDHLRHASLNTTALYMRRPEDAEGEVALQDFDDVL